MKHNGFTLIELSIVLVIIGLIVGGVLVGRDLIKAAEARKDISTLESYSAAANAFKLKYNYLPGDLPNADTLMTIPNYSESPWVSVIRGNGILTMPNGMWDIAESQDFFYELNAVGLGSFVPSGRAIADNAPGLGYPAMISSPSSGWFPFTMARSGISPVGAPLTHVGGLKNWYRTGYVNDTAGAGGGTLYPVAGFTPAIGYGIDSKIDDGNGTTGGVLVLCGNGWDWGYADLIGAPGGDCIGAGACTTATGAYALTSTAKSCALGIRAGF